MSYLSEIDRAHAPSNVADLVYRPHRRLSPMCRRIYSCVRPIQKAKTNSYLGLLIDDRVTWCPAVKATLAMFFRLLVDLRKLHGSSLRNSQCSMLRPCRGSYIYRLLHSQPLDLIGASQWVTLKTLNRVALKMCLGLPSHVPNMVYLWRLRRLPFSYK